MGEGLVASIRDEITEYYRSVALLQSQVYIKLNVLNNLSPIIYIIICLAFTQLWWGYIPHDQTGCQPNH